MKAIRVLLIAPEPWQPELDEYTSGTAPNPYQIYEDMREMGIEVQLLDPSDRFVKLTARWHALYTGLDPIRAWQILTKHRRVDLVISVFESPCAIPVLLRRLMRYRPKIAIWDLIPERGWLPRKLLQRFTIPRVDQLFVLSNLHIKYLRTKYGRGGAVIWHHVDAEFYQPVAADVRGPVLAIGDNPGRDFETFLNAIDNCDVEAIVKTSRQLTLESTNARVRQIRNRLTFLDLRRLYAEAGIVVVPLHQTLNASGVGSILEAMAMAKPLIVSDNPAIRDYIIADQTAVVVPPHDPLSMREAILALRRDPERAMALGRAARQFVEAKFANPVFARRLATEIRHVVHGSATLL